MGINILGYGLKSLANPSIPVTLQGGQYWVLPSGQYLVDTGKYTWVQYYDPVSNTWRNLGCTAQSEPFYLSSDGYNYRLANLTGCVIGAVVTNGGTANTAKNGIWPGVSSNSTSGVTVTTTGTAILNAIVGGSISTTVTVNTGGSGYLLPPIVTFSPPPQGGLQATGHAVLTSGAVSSVVVDNAGAGYTTAPTITFTPLLNAIQGATSGSNSNDPGVGATATATLDATQSGKLVAVTMYNYGSAYTAVPTLTVNGLSGSPAATAIMCFAVTTAPTVTGATNMGNGSQLSLAAGLTAGSNTTTNPAYTTGLFQPRNGLCAYNTSATAASQVLLDGGLSQVDASNLGVFAWASNGTIPGATTFTGGASGGVLDTTFIIPI